MHIDQIQRPAFSMRVASAVVKIDDSINIWQHLSRVAFPLSVCFSVFVASLVMLGMGLGNVPLSGACDWAILRTPYCALVAAKR